MINNKFLTILDDTIQDLHVSLPAAWWSRPYEYAFAARFLSKSHEIVDAGCGLEHPFKWYASMQVKKVYAIDHDERIDNLNKGEPITTGDPLSIKIFNDQKDTILKCENIAFIRDSFITIELSGIDTIFCISVLEHLSPEDQQKAVNNFYKMLKSGGMLVMTLDYPTVKPDAIVNLIEKIGFKLFGKTDYKPDAKENIGYQMFKNLKVFTLVAKKGK